LIPNSEAGVTAALVSMLDGAQSAIFRVPADHHPSRTEQRLIA
jgi:hypothetical protein